MKRLQEYVRNDRHQSTYVVGETAFDIFGFPGVGIQRLCQRVHGMDLDRYDIVIISCGSNDLCKVNLTPERVAADILQLAQHLIASNKVHKVIITELLHRTRCSHRHFEITLDEFNERVRNTNEYLASICTGSVQFWKHDYRVRRQSSLGVDGVHLNQYGVQHFERSIRRAISAFL